MVSVSSWQASQKSVMVLTMVTLQCWNGPVQVVSVLPSSIVGLGGLPASVRMKS